MPASAFSARTSPLLIVISAPSGGGKTTLCQGLLAARPGVTRAITCTTRVPRGGERDGLDYHFLQVGDFARRVKAGEFLEHATVHGNLYGTLKSEVLGRLAAGQDVLLNIDVQGAESVRAQAATDPILHAALVNVFLTPGSMIELERRLRKRATDSEETIQRRLAAARAELAQWDRFDYLILSQTPEEDLRRLQVIVDAEKMHIGRTQAPVF
jgi:guanylate kinase